MFEVTLNATLLLSIAAIFAFVADTDKITSAAAWVTVIVCEVTPVVDNVTVTIRLAGVGLAAAIKTSVALPVFATLGLIVSQLWSDVGVHDVLEVTEIESLLFIAAATLAIVADTDKVATPAACVIVTVCERTPIAEIVTVAVRATMVGFAVAVNESVASPEVGTLGFKVSHVWFDDAVHLVLDVTEIEEALLFAFAILAVIADTDKIVSPACVTVMVLGTVTPEAVMETVAVRASKARFADAVNASVALL